MTSLLFKKALEADTAPEGQAQTDAAPVDAGAVSTDALEQASQEAQNKQDVTQSMVTIKVGLEALKTNIGMRAGDPISRMLVDQSVQRLKTKFGDTSRPVVSTESNASWRRQTTMCLESLIGDASRVIEQPPESQAFNDASIATADFFAKLQNRITQLKPVIASLKKELSDKVQVVAADPTATHEFTVAEPMQFEAVLSFVTKAAVTGLTLSRDFMKARVITAGDIERIKKELCADMPLLYDTDDTFNTSGGTGGVNTWLRPYVDSGMGFISVQKETTEPIGQEVTIEKVNQEGYLGMLNTALDGLQAMDGLLSSIATDEHTTKAALVVAYQTLVFTGMALTTLMDKALDTYAMLR